MAKPDEVTDAVVTTTLKHNWGTLYMSLERLQLEWTFWFFGKDEFGNRMSDHSLLYLNEILDKWTLCTLWYFAIFTEVYWKHDEYILILLKYSVQISIACLFCSLSSWKWKNAGRNYSQFFILHFLLYWKGQIEYLDNRLQKYDIHACPKFFNSINLWLR